MPISHPYDTLRRWAGSWPLHVTVSAPTDQPGKRISRRVRIWGISEDQGELVLRWEDQDGHVWSDGLRVSREHASLDWVGLRVDEVERSAEA